MSTVTAPPPLSYPSAALPRKSAFNSRVLVVIVVFAALVGYPTYSIIMDKIHHGITKVSDGSMDVDLKTLGYFPFDADAGTIESVPPDFRALDGKRVNLEGFMFVGQQSTGKVDRFQFVYNIGKCCYSGPPLVQERVFAYTKRTSPVDYTDQMVRISGILHVNVQRDEVGKCVSVYTFDVQKVDPV